MLHTIATVIVGVPTILLLLVVAGQFLPIAGFSFAGSSASGRTFSIALVGAVLVVLTGLLFAEVPSVGGAVVTAAAVSAVLGSLVNGLRQLRFAAREDVAISLAPTLRRPRIDESPDFDEVFTILDDEPVSLSVWKARGAVRPAPMILMVHGGGWVMGERTGGSTPGHARWFADRGYVVAGADYSLSTFDRHLWNVQEGQIADALVWMLRNAERIGGDPRRIALVGESAGGNLILNVGSRITAGEWSQHFGAGERIAIRAVSALYPAVDLRAIAVSPTVILRRWLRSLVTRYTGGSPEDVPERYDAVDCSTHVHADSPPALLAWGTRDHLVPPRTIRAYAQRLSASGVATKTLVVPHCDHGFDEEGTIGCQVWRESTRRWFAAHGT